MLRPVPLVLVLVALAFPLAAGCLDRATPPTADAAAAPLPLDPLSPAERTRAVDAAVLDPGVRDALGDGRARFVAVFLHVDKALVLSGESPRLADVLAYRYATDDVLWIVVDLAREAVASVTIERFQPRLTYEEVLEAKGLALASPDARARFGDGAGVDIRARLFVSPDPSHVCASHRCVQATFVRGDQPLDAPPLLVDLSARALPPVPPGLPEVI